MFFFFFFSSECVCAVYGTLTSYCVFAVFTLFMVPSRANMSSLFMLFFSSECVYAVYGTFTSEYVYLCYFFSSGCVYVGLYVAFFWRICFRCLWRLIICLRCYGTFLSASEYVYAVMWNSYQRICFALLYATFASDYGYAGLWNSFSSYYVFAVIWNFLPTHMFALLCVPTVVLFMLLARSGFTRSVFIFCLSCVWLNQIGVAALSVKIEALEKQVSADSVDRALVCVRQLAGRLVGLSDGTAIVAALESLADVSRSAGHVDFKRHEAILKQCRPLTHDPKLPAVVTQLLGDDESKKIAGQIQKILKSDHLFSAPQVHGSPFPAPARAPGYLRQLGSGRGRYTPYGYGSYNNNYASRGFNTTRCYNCRKTGHRIANCPALKRA